MNAMFSMLKRNVKIFFKDKGMFFTSLITPIILLVLFVTFLGGVYRDIFTPPAEAGFVIESSIIESLTAGYLFSSLLAVSCITVAFCSNMLMVQDKVSGARRDLLITPVKKTTLALSYYLATFLSTFIICLTAIAACLIYTACVGWYMSFGDIMFVVLDVFLMTMFGTALSSIINVFLSSQGQISAIATIISAGYGFICGAYMPIATFGEGLQTVLMFLPGTYGTVLIKNHTMAGAFRALEDLGVPTAYIDGVKESIDMNVKFFGNDVSITAMFLVVGITVALLVGAYVLINVLRKNSVKK